MEVDGLLTDLEHSACSGCEEARFCSPSWPTPHRRWRRRTADAYWKYEDTDNGSIIGVGMRKRNEERHDGTDGEKTRKSGVFGEVTFWPQPRILHINLAASHRDCQ